MRFDDSEDLSYDDLAANQRRQALLGAQTDGPQDGTTRQDTGPGGGGAGGGGGQLAPSPTPPVDGGAPPSAVPPYQESTVPGQTPWAPGSDHPSSAPPGMMWDPNMANFVPLPGAGAETKPDTTWWDTVGKYQAQHGSGGGGGTQQTYQGGANSQFLQGGGLPPELKALFDNYNALIQQQMNEQQQIRGSQRDALLRLINQSQQPVDQNDPVIADARNAYRAQNDIAARGQRSALAERLAAEGLNPGGQGSGAFDTGVQGIGEQSGRASSQYAANLQVNELHDRRNLLVQALQMADAMGARTESQQLQAQLAQIDAALKQQQLALSYTGLQQGQGQYQDSLSFQYAQLLANANRDALIYGARG
jgi:hypothetical protein